MTRATYLRVGKIPVTDPVCDWRNVLIVYLISLHQLGRHVEGCRLARYVG